MRLIIVGCEYAGTTTLVDNVGAWVERAMGGTMGKHDHWKIPEVSHSAHTKEENLAFLALSPALRESFQRYHMEYHMSRSFYADPHHVMVGFHIDEAIYAPLYYGYGGEGQPAARGSMARRIEAKIMEMAPDTALVLVKASPEVIARRMKEEPRHNRLVQEKDIELVLQRFEEEYDRSWLGKKFTLDTSAATVEESLAQFVEQFEPLMTEGDRLRMLTHQSVQKGG